MQAIYASKLYRASKHKEKIKAALADPTNVELVQQLRTYLDDEYVDEKYLEPEDADESATPGDAAPEDSRGDKSIVHPGSSHASGGGGFSMPPEPHDFDALDDATAEHEEEIPNMPSPSDDGSDEEPEVVEDAQITSVSEDVPRLDDAPADIKELLNSSEDASGVSRASVKNDELWIHYNDSINLNNVMEPVIDHINSSRYSFLNFSRLARTENAIVFSKS